MNRRGVLIMSVAAAFLTACGGGNSRVEGSESSSTSRLLGRSSVTPGNSGKNSFLVAASTMLGDKSKVQKFLLGANAYFTELGFNDVTIAENSRLISTIQFLVSPDFQTSIEIDDKSYLTSYTEKMRSGKSGIPAYAPSEATMQAYRAIGPDFSIRSTATLLTKIERDIAKIIKTVDAGEDISARLIAIVTYVLQIAG